MDGFTNVGVGGEDDGGDDEDGDSGCSVEPEAGVINHNLGLVEEAEEIIIVDV